MDSANGNTNGNMNGNNNTGGATSAGGAGTASAGAVPTGVGGAAATGATIAGTGEAEKLAAEKAAAMAAAAMVVPDEQIMQEVSPAAGNVAAGAATASTATNAAAAGAPAEKTAEKASASTAANATTANTAANAAMTNPAAGTEAGELMSATKAPLSTDVTIEALLDECVRHNASDLHLQVGVPPVLRIDGVLRPMTTYPVLTPEMVRSLVFATLDEEQKKILEKDKEFDYSFAFGDLGRFRANAFYEKGNMAAAFRLIANQVKSFEELGMPGVISTFTEHPNGLVLVTGPTGSGKSTTLTAMLDQINSQKAVHIITIEDPIEFTHRSKRSIVAQREVDYDTFSFAAALRSILREDPDVVLIGELRDLETIQTALTVAETGHLVLSTLHTNSAAQSIDRIIDVFPAHQQPQIRAQLANVLIGIVSQRLVPAVQGGRVAVAEILVANSAVRSIIREGKTPQLDMAIQTGVELGMQTMDRELARLVKGGVINYDDARSYAVNVAEFERLARG